MRQFFALALKKSWVYILALTLFGIMIAAVTDKRWSTASAESASAVQYNSHDVIGKYPFGMLIRVEVKGQWRPGYAGACIIFIPDASINTRHPQMACN